MRNGMVLGRRRGWRWLVVALFAAVAASAISSAGTSARAATAKPSPVVAAAKAKLAKLYAGTSKAPSGDPVPAQKGKKVFVISCGQVVPGCSVPTAGAVAAGTELGWNVTVLDTALDYAKQGSNVDQAVAGGAQGIIMVGNDCLLSPASFQRAKDAHIPVVNIFGADCNEPYKKGDPVGADLWTEARTANYTTNPRFWQGYGVAKAQWVIAKTNGKARVLAFDITNSALDHAQTVAFEAAMAKCKTCKV